MSAPKFYNSGSLAISGALTGAERVSVDAGQAQNATVTTQQIANLAGSDAAPTITAITTAGAGTLTAAGLVGRVINRTGPTADFTDTTDTVANIIAALPNAYVGQAFFVDIKNNSSWQQTIAGATSVTVSGITVIPSLMEGRFLVVLTSLTAIAITGISLSSIAGTITNAIQNGDVTVTATLTQQTSTGLLNVTGLSVNVQAGQTYNFKGWLHGTAGASGGLKVQMSGTATLTSFSGTGVNWNGAGPTCNAILNVTGLGASLAATTAAYSDLFLDGTFVVATAGTITVQMAQNASNGTATTITAGTLQVRRTA